MISEITERVRPEIKNMTQRTANSVSPEMKSKKNRCARQNVADRFFENKGFLAGTKYGFRDLIACKGVSIVTPDAKICGGITEFMKIAALTQANDLAVSPHGSQEVHTHLAAAIPNTILLEYFPREFDAMWGKRYEHNIELNPDRTVSPPDLPGFGAEPFYHHLEQFRVT